MLGAVVGGTVALQALATQVPLLRRILGVTPLAGGDWVLIGGAAVASLGLIRLGRGVTPAIAPAIRVRT